MKQDKKYSKLKEAYDNLRSENAQLKAQISTYEKTQDELDDLIRQTLILRETYLEACDEMKRAKKELYMIKKDLEKDTNAVLKTFKKSQ